MAYHINAGVLARVNILTNSIIQHFQTEQKATSSLFNANEKCMWRFQYWSEFNSLRGILKPNNAN